MSKGTIILLIILAIVLVALGLLYYFGNRMQKKQEAQQEQLAAAAQQVSLLVIDKKKMKLKDAGFPQIIVDNTPKYLRRSKVPVVKAKIGPRIMTMMCDTQIYDLRRENFPIDPGQKGSQSSSQRYLYHRCQRTSRKIRNA